MSCAAAVYNPSKEHDFGGSELKQLRYIKPSHGGTAKATTFTVVEGLEVLFVAIRGSASVMDHTVNANVEMASPVDFIVCLTAVPSMIAVRLTLPKEWEGTRSDQTGARKDSLPCWFLERCKGPTAPSDV